MEDYRVSKSFEKALRDSSRKPSNIIYTLKLVKEIFKRQLDIKNVMVLSSSNRALAMRQYFTSNEDVQYPLCFVFISGIGVDQEIAPSVKNMMRTTTGHRLSTQESSQSVLASYLIPATLTVEFSVFFDDEYEAYQWMEEAIIPLAGNMLGGELLFEGFEYSARQKDPVSELSIPNTEPDSVPMPNAIEITSSMILRTKVGRVKEIAKFNNENHLNMNLNIGDEVVSEDFLGDSANAKDDEPLATEQPLTGRPLSRKDFINSCSAPMRQTIPLRGKR